jgi:hypothetical protein
MNTHFIKKLSFAAVLTISALAAVPNLTAQTPPVTLAKPATPVKAPNADGFIQRWLVLEPIAATGVTDNAVQALVKKDLFPNQFGVVPKDGDKVSVGNNELTWHALDTLNYNVNLFHFARAQGKKTSDVLFWDGDSD